MSSLQLNTLIIIGSWLQWAVIRISIWDKSISTNLYPGAATNPRLTFLASSVRVGWANKFGPLIDGRPVVVLVIRILPLTLPSASASSGNVRIKLSSSLSYSFHRMISSTMGCLSITDCSISLLVDHRSGLPSTPDALVLRAIWEYLCRPISLNRNCSTCSGEPGLMVRPANRLISSDSTSILPVNSRSSNENSWGEINIPFDCIESNIGTVIMSTSKQSSIDIWVLYIHRR